MEEFKVNEYITLKLEKGKTNIYIKGELFKQCKSLLLTNTTENINIFEEIESVDEISEMSGFSLEESIEKDMTLEIRKEINNITPEIEYWVHCSNLQVWAEYKYDTTLIHSNLAFPLLKKLANFGDPIARRIFKEEIGKRYFTGVKSVQSFLEEEGYLESLSKEEIRSFIDSGVDVLDELEDILGKEFYITTILKSIGSPTAIIKNGKIIGLNIRKMKLKEIPDCIQRLEDLEIFDMTQNMNEEIPDWIGKLGSLKKLIGGHKIKKIPESIGKLRSLQVLNLAGNQIEILPDSIGNLISLKELKLYSNKIKNLPDTLGNLINLEDLSLNKNPLISLPESLGNLKNLKDLSLTFDPIDNLPASIVELPSLKDLVIARTNINKDNKIIKELKKKKDLNIFL